MAEASLKILRLCHRDNWTCWICRGKITLPIDLESPAAPSRDHVIPRSRLKKMPRLADDAEYHDENRRNIRLAHRWCNSHRQSKTLRDEDRPEYVKRLALAVEEYEEERQARELLRASESDIVNSE